MVVAAAVLLSIASIQAYVGRVPPQAEYVGRVPPQAEYVGRVPPQADPPKSAIQQAAPAGNIANGGVLFKKIGCYQCHGGEGQGGLSGPRIGPNLFPQARYVQYLRKPAGDMPPYTSKVLSDQEIADIWAWVQARPRPPAVGTLPQLAP